MEFAPELGRHRVFQVSNRDDDADDEAIAYTSRGRTLTSRGRPFDALTRDWWNGWRFRVTKLSEEYTLEELYRDRGDNLDLILAKRPDGGLEFIGPGKEDRAEGLMVLSFSPVKDQKDARGEGARRDGGTTLAGPSAPLPE